MFSKSLNQFSVDGQGCIHSLFFDQTMLEVMKIMSNCFKRSHACPATFSVPTTQQATTDPRRHQRLLDTQGQVWVSLFWGPCSLLLGPGAHKVFCAFQKSDSPFLCNFWWLYGGVNGDLLQEGLCHTQVCCTQSP